MLRLIFDHLPPMRGLYLFDASGRERGGRDDASGISKLLSAFLPFMQAGALNAALCRDEGPTDGDSSANYFTETTRERTKGCLLRTSQMTSCATDRR